MIFEKFILKVYTDTLIQRHDEDGTIFYFSREDFPGLESEAFSFTGNKEQKMHGEIYYRDVMRTDRIIIFEHGMGCGHVAYMREIDLITKNGYTVVTYDHTGTRLSEGENIGGFSQSLCDLEHCVKAIRADERLKNSTLSVIGHSWGGFSAMNSPAVCPEITHAVAFAGFISPKDIQEQVFSGLLKFYRKSVLNLETTAFPKHSAICAVDTLKNADTKALIIHSKDDSTVSYDKHFIKLKNALNGVDRVKFIGVDGKNHNPNYTKDAVNYKDAFASELKKKLKKNELQSDEAKKTFKNSFDWWRMTEQDADLWNKVFEFLES